MSKTRISTVRSRILGEAPTKTEQTADAVQGSIFASIFSALEKILEGPAKLALFPAATVISWYKTIKKTQAYNKALNKNIFKTVDTRLDLVAAVAETFAVGVAVTGSAIVSAAMIPAIFLGMIATKFVYHAAQTAWYGVKCAASWLRGDTFTAQHAENKAKFQGNLRGSLVLGAVGATIGLLMFAPAWGLLALGATVVAAVKGIGAAIVALNVLFTGREIYKMRKAEKQAELSAKAELDPALEADHVGEIPVPNEEVEKQNLINPEASKKPTKFRDFYVKYQAQPAEIVDVDAVDAIAKPVKLVNNFNSLVNHHDDLIRKMDMSESRELAEQFMLELIIQERVNISLALGANVSDLDTNGNFVENPQLAWSSPFEKAKRYAKLEALDSIEKLVKDGQTIMSEEGSSNKTTMIDVDGLMTHLKDKNKSEMVFKSSFNHVGGMEKIFLVADEFVKNIQKLTAEEYSARRDELSGSVPAPAA
ncbi:MAG: hypothetical protein ABI597_07050 [Gammaproteobacteria bacterium]